MHPTRLALATTCLTTCLALVVACGGTPPAVEDAGACPAGQQRCGDRCADLSEDVANCGACGVACPAGALCAAGGCYLPDCPNTDCSATQICRDARCASIACLGVQCAAGELCSEGRCFPTQCPTGTCSPGACVDGLCVDLSCNGVVCPTGRQCVGGLCVVPCTDGAACAPPNPCHEGRTTCTPDSAACTDTGIDVPNGAACGASRVCLDGTCVACVAGAPCSTNPNPCKAGITSCATGTRMCVDAQVNAGAGASCGTDKVCDGAGSCLDCAAGTACTSNPNPCRVGAVQCASGVPTCGDSSANVSPGTACGSALVCNSAGTCVSCSAGQPCTGNPNACKVGVTSCATGAQTCVDSSVDVAAGTSCGAGSVCNGSGGCVGCAAGSPCATNPNPCKVGVTSCATGASTCVDSATNRTAGTSCGASFVCDNNGQCLGCTAGAACTGNPNPCRTGVISCATGAAVCTDGPGAVDGGVSCGTNQVCSGAGTCVACTEGAACTGNTNPCLAGETRCATGAPVCGNSVNAVAAGTSCGNNLVCAGDGGCVACTAGAACATNPNACRLGAISCTTGGPVCVDTAVPSANGGACGADQRCLGGECLTAASCRDYLLALGGAASGTYLVDPDGDGGVSPFRVRCDMTTAGGGWTKIWEEFLLPQAQYEAEATNAALRPDDLLTDAIDAGTFAHLSAAQVNGIAFTQVSDRMSGGYFGTFNRGAATFDFSYPGPAWTNGDPAGLSFNYVWGNDKSYQAWRLSPEASLYGNVLGTSTLGYAGFFGVRKAGSHVCGSYGNYPVDLVRRSIRTGDYFANCYAGQQQWDHERTIWVR